MCMSNKHFHQHFFWVTQTCKQFRDQGRIYTQYISRKARAAFDMRFLNCIQSKCCKRGDNARLYIQRDKQEVTTAMTSICSYANVVFWLSSLLMHCRYSICEKGQWLLTFRITVTEWETFCDHLPTWLVLICIQSRDLQSDLTCGEICAANTNSRTFPNKLFFSRMHVYHKRVQTCISLWHRHYHTFLRESKFFHFQWPSPLFLISDSGRIALKLHFPPVTPMPFLQSEIKMQGDQWVTPVAFRDTCM